MTSMAIVPSQLHELVADEEKASEMRSFLRKQGMEHLLGDPKHCSTDCTRLLFQCGADGHVSNLRSSSLILSKSEATCRYYTMSGGCVRGEKCLFSHPAAEFMSLEMGQSFIPKQVGGPKRVGAEDLGKKIFVGGLSPSVESEALREFFEVNYGPVLDAVVIGSQAGDQMQSRGFGFVTFKHAASVSAAVETRYISIYGKKVEIKGAVPRYQMPVLEVSRSDSDTHPDPAMTGNKILDFNEAEVLEIATPGSLCLPKNELPPCNETSSPAEPQQTSSSESTPSCLSDLSSAGRSKVSGDSCLQPLIREVPPESASSTFGGPSAGGCKVFGDSYLQSLTRKVPPESASSSFGCPSANASSVPRDRSVSQSVLRGASSTTVLGGQPAWLNAFKEWLPQFLSRVSLRLKDGEWYPLSSLKGDYRAICGLELDHASLGFEKLSDFVRSFPELCRVKIVPVGRGPATHMVLLPPMNQNIPSAAGRRNVSNITTRSLVDGTRSYAEVACHGSAARLGRSDGGPASDAAICRSGSHLGHQGKQAGAPAPAGGMTSSTDHQAAFPYGLHEGLPLRGNGPSAAAGGDNAGLKATCTGPPKVSSTYSNGRSRSSGTPMTSISSSSSRCRSASEDTLVRSDDTETLSIGETGSSDINSGLAKEDVALLLELISRLKMTGKEHAPPANHAATGSWFAPVTMHEAPPGQYSQSNSSKTVDNEGERPVYSPFFEKDPKTPVRGNNALTTPFNHPFAGFLSENFPPRSMWGQDPNRMKVGGYGIQGSGIETFKSAYQLYEDSQSNESSFSTPTGNFSASSSPGEGLDSKIAGICEMCFERPALWVAVPCGHANMCSFCKNLLRQGNGDHGQCLVCNGSVERWIALH